MCEQSRLPVTGKESSLPLHELSLVERGPVGKFGGLVVDVGAGTFLQRSNDLHVRPSGPADVRHPQCPRADALRPADAECGAAPRRRAGVAGAVFRQILQALPADSLSLSDCRALADRFRTGELPLRPAAARKRAAAGDVSLPDRVRHPRGGVFVRGGVPHFENQIQPRPDGGDPDHLRGRHSLRVETPRSGAIPVDFAFPGHVGRRGVLRLRDPVGDRAARGPVARPPALAARHPDPPGKNLHPLQLLFRRLGLLPDAPISRRTRHVGDEGGPSQLRGHRGIG